MGALASLPQIGYPPYVWILDTYGVFAPQAFSNFSYLFGNSSFGVEEYIWICCLWHGARGILFLPTLACDSHLPFCDHYSLLHSRLWCSPLFSIAVVHFSYCCCCTTTLFLCRYHHYLHLLWYSPCYSVLHLGLLNSWKILWDVYYFVGSGVDFR